MSVGKDMASSPKEKELPSLTAEPTIWALRKNSRTHGNDEAADEAHTLYHHLFGYDPISLIRNKAKTDDSSATSAENPKLNILNPRTNFAVLELASELPPEDGI